MKFRIQTRFCLAIYDFEARIKFSLCLTFQGTIIIFYRISYSIDKIAIKLL